MKLFDKTYWSRVLEGFLIAVGATFIAQLTQIQDAINAGDWNTAKKLLLSLIYGAIFALIKAAWLAIVVKRQENNP